MVRGGNRYRILVHNYERLSSMGADNPPTIGHNLSDQAFEVRLQETHGYSLCSECAMKHVEDGGKGLATKLLK